MSAQRKPIVLGPGQGRVYAMPTMRALFKADGAETDSRYSVSEWWLEPRGGGPGAHSHEANDEVFLVVAGAATILVADEWITAPPGTVVVIPAGVTHDFRNDTDAEVGLFNVFMPGGFEEKMPEIVRWYEENP